MPASPETYVIASGEPLGAGRFVAPDWAPAAGEIKTISKAAGFFGTNGGATLAEINPAYQSWNPDAPSLGVFGIKNPNNGIAAYSWGSITGYCGSSFNTDKRQLVMYGAGHASANVYAPFAFDLADRKWKWLDESLPFDGYARLWFNGYNPDKTTTLTYYSEDEIDYDWGEVKGDYSGYGAFARPGIVQPIPGHSRSNLTHIPASLAGNAGGKLFNFCGSAGVLSGNYSRKSHLWDYDTARWSRTAQWFPEAAGPGHWRGSKLDVETGKVIIMGSCGPSSPLYVHDVESGIYTARYPINSVTSCSDIGGCLVHEVGRLFIMPAARDSSGASANGLNGATFEFIAGIIDEMIGAGSFTLASLNVIVESTWPLTSAGNNLSIGWQYCPVDKCLYTINGTGGSDKYWRLAPPPNATTPGEYLTGTWTLSELTFLSGANAATGISWMYNRLSWDKKSRSFIFISDGTSAPVQAFRPAGV